MCCCEYLMFIEKSLPSQVGQGGGCTLRVLDQAKAFKGVKRFLQFRKGRR
jgi:hypothetical protein